MTDDREPELLDALALLRAQLRGDEEACDAYVEVLDLRAFFGYTVGVLLTLLTNALPGGRDELDDLLRRMQEQQRRDVL